MKFKIHKENGALNSVPIFAALEQGIQENGVSLVNQGQDVDVIWSVLWHGRMKANQAVYEHYRSQGKPVIVIDIGALYRGTTWKLAVNHITRDGYYGHEQDLDWDRP